MTFPTFFARRVGAGRFGHAAFAGAAYPRFMSNRITVWYDGGCPLCVREIALMDRLDKHNRIEFVDLERNDASCPLERDVLLARLHARAGDGELVDGAAAFAAMWRQIPVMRPLGLAAKSRVVLWVLEQAYRGFLVVRPSVQRLFMRISGDRTLADRKSGSMPAAKRWFSGSGKAGRLRITARAKTKR